MKTAIFPLQVKTSGASHHVPTLTLYAPEAKEAARPAVVIFSGGAYKVVSQYEGEPTAAYFVERGFVALVLHYSCMPATFPQSLCEGLLSVAFAREHAEELGIDPERVFVIGFSAGGHLAAAVGTLFDHPSLTPYLGEEREIYRPNKLVLCYPVISNEGAHHEESFVNLLLGGAKDPALRHLTCLEHQVTASTPPSFVWHGGSDSIVPAEGTLRFVEALTACGIRNEFHLYPHANHGGGLCRGQPQAEWAEKARTFLLDETV